MSSPLVTSPITDFPVPVSVPLRPPDYFATHHKKTNSDTDDSLNESTSSIETTHSLMAQNVSSETLVEDDYFKHVKPPPVPLKRQLTLPLLPVLNFQNQNVANFSNSNSLKRKIDNLSPKIMVITKDIVPGPNNLLIDIRPFPEFVTSHISNAISICLPSTLLKRPTFTLQKCVNSLPPSEQQKFNDYLTKNSHQDIYIYDSSNYSQNLFHILSKFINSPLINLANINIYVFAFTDFTDSSKLVKEKSSDNSSLSSNINNMLPPINMEKCRSHSLSNLSTSTPILSGFVLPKKQNTNFKLRHNEELMNSALQSNTLNLFNLLIPENTTIPDWLNNTIKDLNNLNNDFHQLEKIEHTRLLKALNTNGSAEIPNDCLVDEVPPVISSGFEYGRKNRYKDIFLYENTRVKLNDFNNEDDYINASYINPPNLNDNKLDVTYDLNFNYIATQGPLTQTIGDFWYLVFKMRSPIIVSLTDEVENGVIKCSRFWQTGVYHSGNLSVNVSIAKQEQVNDHLIFRHIKISHNDIIQNVLQVHLLSWPDMGTCLDPHEIIQIVELKYHLLNSIKTESQYPCIIHCSAGCGRTGTLCTIDTLINILKQNEMNEFTTDPIFTIVNNLRQQRISMVQNLRQYYLIYDLAIDYLTEHNPERNQHLTTLPIVREFINNYLH